jgi:hypothetical protein
MFASFSHGIQSSDSPSPDSREASGYKRGSERDLDVTQDDLLEAREVASTLSLEDVHKVGLDVGLDLMIDSQYSDNEESIYTS